MNGLQITAPHFCAGLFFDKSGTAQDVAPILHYMRGWSEEQIRDYCGRKGWTVEPVNATAH